MSLSHSLRKIIVAVAPVGADTPATAQNPLSPQAVAQDVIACAQAGAAMVHLHVRDDQGAQTADPQAFSQTLDLIRASSDIVIQASTGGLTDLSLEQRCVAVTDPRVQTASLNMGSVNIGEDVYINRLPDIRYWARRMAETDVAPELEIFEAGMIAVFRQLVREKVLTAPYTLNFGLGFHWALPADPKSLFFMTSLMPETQSLPWGVVHDAMTDLSLLATAVGMGASVVRVGFEDSIYFAPDKIAPTNAQLVVQAAAMIRSMGFELATSAEARQILGID